MDAGLVAVIVTVVLPEVLTVVLGTEQEITLEMLLDTAHEKETGPLKLFTGATETLTVAVTGLVPGGSETLAGLAVN